MAELNEEVLSDLLGRVKKLEVTSNPDDIKSVLESMDRTLSVLIMVTNVLASILKSKGIVTEEELTKAVEEEKTRIEAKLQSNGTTENKTENSAG